jgi:hypothetical protein
MYQCVFGINFDCTFNLNTNETDNFSNNAIRLWRIDAIDLLKK